METKQAKVVVSMLALVVLPLLSLSGQAAESQEFVPLEADIAVLTDDGPRTPISSVPRTITSSGSYYLTKDLQTTSGSQNAIVVDADNVTIDLMGFSLIGRGAGDGCGIFMNGRDNVEIRNGTVRNFGSDGIREAKNPTEESPSFGYAHRVISIRALFNKGDGIELCGIGHLVRDCSAMSNGVDGIYVGALSTVTGNITSLNAAHGIELTDGCAASSNTSVANQLNGIWTWNGCSVMSNTLYGNGCGIYVSEKGSFVKGNTLRNNLAYNIFVKGTDNAIEENLVTYSEYGIRFDSSSSGNFYANNRAAGNTYNFSNTSGQIDGGGNVSF